MSNQEKTLFVGKHNLIIGWFLKKLRIAEYGKNHKKYQWEDDEWK
jgi:hypothetical protein